MNVVIRRANEKDVATISALAEKTFYDTFQGTCTEEDIQGLIKDFFSEDAIGKELSDPEDFCFIAEIDGVPTGYYRFKENAKAAPEFNKYKSIELKRFYVINEYHGKGIAQQMMDHFSNYVQANGYEMIFLSVWEFNFKAQKFYEKCGFTNSGLTNYFPIGTTPQYDFWYWKFF